MNTKKYAVVDLETTGHSPINGDRIIQIAIVLIEDGKICDKYVKFVNPGQKIPAFIRQLTNISDEDVENALYFEDIAFEVRQRLEGAVFVAHNTDFDLPFLQSEFGRCGIAKWTGQIIDTVELAKIVYPSSPSYRLQDIAEELGIPLPSAHRADDDAEATSKLLLACNKKLHSLPKGTLELLHKRSFYLKTDLSSLFYEALKAVRKKIEGSDFATFRNIPYKTKARVDKCVIEELSFPLDDAEKKSQLKKAFPSYEYRESQYRFMDAVWDTLANESEIAAEVPTGIGKTIAYLLPAAIRSVKTGKPVVISTYTNYLADKLLEEELTKLRLIIGADLTAVVIKGKEQYISLGKFQELLIISEESYDESFTIMQVLVWLTETVSGDLEELNVSGGGQLFVDRIRNRARKMALDEQEADYYNRHMIDCSQSNVIITNHSMLLADLNRNKPLFGSLSGLIVDEAHQFVHTASKFNETVFSYTNWKYIMGQIGSETDGHLLHQIFSLADRLSIHLMHSKASLMVSYAMFTDSFDKAIGILAHYESHSDKRQQGNRKVYLLNEIEDMNGYFSKVVAVMKDYIDVLEAIDRRLIVHTDNMTNNEQALLSEWSYWIQELKIKVAEWVELFLEKDFPDYAVWMEKDKRSIPGSLIIVKRPLDGSIIIRKLIDSLKEQNTGIIWTSGTLSICDNERYIPNQLGVKEQVPLLTFDAPKNFYDGAKIFIVKDMPDIQQVSQSEYIEAMTDAIIQTVMVTGGKLFVLFTSKDMLRKTFELIVESRQLEEYALFAQGITPGSRMKLMKSFRQFGNSVLFGTSSFWEGVDVPGDALSAVIVVRLPFSSPEEPIFKARAKKLAAEGKNSFGEYALPEAVMRLRQGFGRLIRSSEDKGFFIILDKRIETKSYGNRFLDSLPKVPIKNVSLEVMVKELENCYNRIE